MANPSLQIGDSNWAIKEDNLLGYSKAGTRFVPQPITMTRESAGTRVNSEGLVETVELLGSEEVTNWDMELDCCWANYASGTTTNERSTEQVYESNYSRKYAATTATTGGIQSDNFTTSTGVTYNVSFWVYPATGTSQRIAVRKGDNSGWAVDNTFSGLTQNSWNNCTITYTETVGGSTSFIAFHSNGVVGTWYIDNVSIKESTKNNLARVDYTDGTSSLLVEPERTNLVTNSEELNSTTNVTPSNTTSPDGTLSGLKLNETTTNFQHYGTSYESAVFSGTIYTVSFYIKKGTHDLVRVYTQSSRISAQINITFSTESTGLSGSDVVSGSNFMEDAGNGWYRVGFSATASSTGAVSIYLPPKDLTTYVGDISQYTEYWGVQLEEGSYATSYIPTDDGTVTRIQDQYEKTGISDLINSEEGSFFVDMAAINEPPFSQLSISLSGDNSNDRILIFTGSGGGEWNVQFRKDGTNYVNVKKSITITNQSKLAVSWKSGKYLMYIDGIKATNYTVGSETEATTFDVGDLKNLQFSPNHNSTSNLFYGKVKHLQVYTSALTDSELKTLTT